MTRSRRRRAAALAAIGSAGLLVLVGLRIRTPAPSDAAPAEDWTEASAAPPPLLAGLRSSPAGTASAPPPEDASAEAEEMGERLAPMRSPFGRGQDDVELPPERVPLDVTVVDPRNAPVPQAEIIAVWGDWRTRSTTADAEGRATLRVPRGTRMLEIVGADRRDARPFLFVHYHSLVGGESATRVVVRVGSAIEGCLVDPDGAPIPAAIVRTVPEIYGYSAVRTDSQGKFRLGALDGQAVDVRFDGEVAERSEHAVQFAGTSGSAGESAHLLRGVLRALASGVVPGGDPIVLRAERVTRTADLEVFVLCDGGPLKGAEVQAQGSGVSMTDERGRALLRGLLVWPIAVQAKWTPPRDEPGVVRVSPVQDVLPGQGPAVLHFEQAAVLRGRVVDERGAPVVKAWGVAHDGSSCGAGFTTDPDGRFEALCAVREGTRLQVAVRGPGKRPTSIGGIDGVVAGEGELRIVLRPVPGR
jgi:hypothetical protein